MPSREREIVFGQAFYPKNYDSESLFVVTDTSPKFNPASISSAEVIISETEEGSVERLGLPGGFSPDDIGEPKEIWSLDRIIKAMGMTFKGDLPEEMKELLSINAAKPSRIV